MTNESSYYSQQQDILFNHAVSLGLPIVMKVIAKDVRPFLTEKVSTLRPGIAVLDTALDSIEKINEELLLAQETGNKNILVICNSLRELDLYSLEDYLMVTVYATKYNDGDLPFHFNLVKTKGRPIFLKTARYGVKTYHLDKEEQLNLKFYKYDKEPELQGLAKVELVDPHSKIARIDSMEELEKFVNVFKEMDKHQLDVKSVNGGVLYHSQVSTAFEGIILDFRNYNSILNCQEEELIDITTKTVGMNTSMAVLLPKKVTLHSNFK